jgi:hypothetical protein
MEIAARKLRMLHLHYPILWSFSATGIFLPSGLFGKKK